MFLDISDLQKLMGGFRGRSYCYRLYRDIRAHYQLPKHCFIQPCHFADYMGLDLLQVYRKLGHPVSPEQLSPIKQDTLLTH